MTATRRSSGIVPHAGSASETLPAMPGGDVQEMILRSVAKPKVWVDVRGAVTGSGLSRSIVDAPAIELTIGDEDRELLRSPLLQGAIELQFGGLPWRVVHVGKTGDNLNLTLVERAAALLMADRGPSKASRADMTRAQFLLSRVKRVRRYPIGFYSPELGRKQPLAGLKKTDRDALRKPGINRSTQRGLTIKGAKASAEQLRNVETCISVGEELKASPRAILAGLVAGIVESLFKNLSGGDRDSAGVIQVRVGLHGADVAKSVEKSYRQFYSSGFTGRGGAIELARKNPGWTPGQIAQAVQGSAFPDRYDQYRAEADKLLEAYGGTSGPTDGGFFERYEFMVGEPDGPKGESTWEAGQRLSDEVAWRFFLVAGTVFYISEADLFKGRPRALLTEDTPGVESIDFDAESNPRFASTAQVKVLADTWAAPPGSVILLEGMGPADGRWLVEEINREDLFADETTIELIKPARELPEPRPQVRSRAEPEDEEGTGDGYPLRGTRGKLIGVPYAGTHTLGNWQSDNAVDIGVPDGTIVQAVGAGTVEKVKGGYSGGSSRFDGFQVTIRLSSGKRVWYTHLSKVSVGAGDRVKKGQAIGRSGSANGVPHLHFACEPGTDPRDLIGLRS